MAKEFNWDEVRQRYADRRRQEGATEEQIESEQVPADKVVWGPSRPTPELKAVKKVEKPREQNGPAKGTKKVTMSDWDKRRILTMHSFGWGNAEISRETGYTTTSIKRYLESKGRTPIDGRSRRYK